MGILSWILLCLVAGVIAKYLHPGPDPGGWLVTIGLGIVGAMVGGFVMSFVGFDGVSGFNIWSV
ncbi:MAG: GlsB/YeaQ/YmgE family stress response membrane protein, partial [Bacteroidota bacterium]